MTLDPRVRSGRRRYRRPASDWTSEVSSAYALAGFLFAVFVGFTLLVMGPLVGIDAAFNVRTPPHGWVPVLHVADHIGQRAVCLPILGVVLFWIWRKTGRLRPVIVAGAAIFVLNAVVAVLKIGLGRGEPHTMNPNFFVGGMAYPSGHTANIVLVYGLVPYLLATYTQVQPRVIKLYGGLVVLLSIWMVTVSVTLTWHWFADLLAGLLIGGMVLALTSAADHAIPRDVFAEGIGRGLRRMPALVLGRSDLTVRVRSRSLGP
ncbi:MAG: phosphatase PAP2 family protein [Actinomycetota bacterium]|nr:phosphatase PAP2 family protein [Actinomycetota bacterium]